MSMFADSIKYFDTYSTPNDAIFEICFIDLYQFLLVLIECSMKTIFFLFTFFVENWRIIYPEVLKMQRFFAFSTGHQQITCDW